PSRPSERPARPPRDLGTRDFSPSTRAHPARGEHAGPGRPGRTRPIRLQETFILSTRARVVSAQDPANLRHLLRIFLDWATDHSVTENDFQFPRRSGTSRPR